MGTGKSSLLTARFRQGKEDYYIGNHPLWEIFRTIYQMKFKPVIIGGLFLYLGYVKAFIMRVKRPIPPELVKFQRKEQMQRLKEKFTNLLRRK